MKQKTRNAPPKASAMLESLRGLGYTTASAIADLIDNSISAQASTINIEFCWREANSWIKISDDGIGMTDADLERAMTLGDKSPLEQRSANDLGRFGMGLKTASFSQCRRLTVASKAKNQELACLRWDLDTLLNDRTGQWLMYEGPAVGSEFIYSSMHECESGTVVVWEMLDRIITTGYSADDYLDLIESVKAHLSMIFHRLLEGSNPDVKILVNGNRVEPWDPFMTGNPAKPWTSLVAETLTESGRVTVQCHVLPHKEKLSEREFNENAGPNGWAAQQGFYVYRNKRLLVAGGWLGLGVNKSWNREEAYRLARIQLDIPNSADALWKIDIRKSIARPPVSLRPWLTRLAEDTRERARKVFAYRSMPTSVTPDTKVEHTWTVTKTKTGLRYRIDTAHPVISAVLDASGELYPLITSMLKVIEESVPVQRIWLDTTENKETAQVGFGGEPDQVIQDVLSKIFADMTIRRGMSQESAKELLKRTEPFQKFPHLIDLLG